MTTLATCVGEETDQTTYPGSADVENAQLPPRPDLVNPPANPPTPTPTRAAEIRCLCTFCGEFNLGVGKPCNHCGKEDTITTRMDATRHTGVWHVLRADLAIALESEAPGMSFDDLRSLIRQKIVTPRSIVRGPATGQLFRLAATVRGLGREFGQCYSCCGEIETNAGVCPHCDRVQTLQEWVEPKPAVPIIDNRIDHQTPISEIPPGAGSNEEKSTAPQFTEELSDCENEPLIPETSGNVRQALLGEPTIRVHSLSHPDEIGDDAGLEFNVRPVIAERNERHIPKDDLLTHVEVAKAFQLEFGMEDNADRPYRIPGRTARQIKVVLAGTSAMAIAFLMGMQAIRMINGKTPAPTRSRVAVATPPTGQSKISSAKVAPVAVVSVPLAPVAVAPVAVVPMPVVPAPIKPATPAIADARLASDVASAHHPLADKPSEPYELPDPCADASPAKPLAVAPPTPVPPAPAKIIPTVAAPANPPVKAIAAAPPATPAPKTAARNTSNMTQVSQVMLMQSPAETDVDDPATLLNTGLAAEASGNYTAAVRAYERIQSLPGNLWPPQLKTRLQLAREELNGDLH
jgi:hypothetical protein